MYFSLSDLVDIIVFSLKRPKKRPRKVPDTRPRVLCAVNRVGTLAKGLLIHGDLNVHLVLLCGVIPTKRLLDRIMNHLPGELLSATLVAEVVVV